MAAPGVLTRYTTAAALARLADEGSRVALLLHVLAVGRGAAFGGLLIGALMVPHVLAAPLVGALADAVRRRRLLYVGGLLGFAAGFTGAALLAAPAPAAAFGAAVLAGCCAPLLIGGLSSLLGELAGDRLPRAFGLDATSYSLAGIVGPALAALVAGWSGALWAVAVLAVSCALAAAIVVSLPVPDRTRPSTPRGRGRAIKALWREPPLTAVTAASTVSQFGLGALPIVAALLATGLHDPAMTGLTLSAFAVGALVSSLAYARLPLRRVRPETVMLAGLAVSSVPFALLTAVEGRWSLLALFAVAGLIDGPTFASLLVVRNREAPPEARTQVFTIGAGLKVTAAAAGVALAGLATGHGTTALLLAVAASQLLAGGLGAALLRRRRPAPRVSPALP
ncbi:MFS transporter [Actinoplanes sp. NPDC048967]|uniref:MFS transporter n=1 Tax=Actinoplanes sp. NPDC048967 TaxID=3155269 RepID=UPI0033D60D99